MAATDQQFEREVAYKLAEFEVKERAPEELPILRAHRDDFVKSGLQKMRSDEDSALALGMGEVVQLLTPEILLIATIVFTAAKAEIEKQLTDKTREIVKAFFQRFLRTESPSKPPEISNLTQDQLSRIKDAALAAATDAKINRTLSSDLISAMVARLQPSSGPAP